MVPRKRLTDVGVRKLKPPPFGKQIDYFDVQMPRLVLRVNYGGRKTWRALYYVKGTYKSDTKSGKKKGDPRTEPRTHPLGLYPHLNVKQAREDARKFLGNPHKGLADANKETFREVAENYIKRNVVAAKNRAELRSRKEIERCLNKYIYPHWEHRAFVEIKRKDVANLLDQVEDNHGARMADVVLGIISAMANWYAGRDDEYVSPIVKTMRRYKSAARSRVLNDDEIRAVWNACDGMGTFGALVKMLLLTAQRLRKVATMRWSDLTDGEWKIPIEPREKENAGTVKLPQMALAIINKQPRIAGNPYVFPADNGVGPFRTFDRKNTLVRRLPEMPRWVLHDLRRSARTLMSRDGVQREHAERALGHVIRGVEGVYDRHEYKKEKSDALQALANLIARIVNPPQDNVVTMPGRSTRKKR
jgi:integrase